MMDLFAACKNGDVGVVKRILSTGVDVNMTDPENNTVPYALMLACREGHLEIVELLLSNGANPNLTDNLPMRRWSPLFYAANSQYVEIIKLLAKHGASIDYVSDDQGLTPLMYSVRGGLTDSIKTLIALGADPDIRNRKYGFSARSLAADKGIQL
jgi:uncharacterized protein